MNAATRAICISIVYQKNCIFGRVTYLKPQHLWTDNPATYAAPTKLSKYTQNIMWDQSPRIHRSLATVSARQKKSQRKEGGACVDGSKLEACKCCESNAHAGAKRRQIESNISKSSPEVSLRNDGGQFRVVRLNPSHGNEKSWYVSLGSETQRAHEQHYLRHFRCLTLSHPTLNPNPRNARSQDLFLYHSRRLKGWLSSHQQSFRSCSTTTGDPPSILKSVAFLPTLI